MNYWFIACMALAITLICVLWIDVQSIIRDTSNRNRLDAERTHWKTRCDELQQYISATQNQAKKDVSYWTAQRDAQIDYLTQTIKDMEATHACEIDMRDKRIFQLEKIINGNWPKVEGKE